MEPITDRDLGRLSRDVLGTGEHARSSTDVLRYWTRKEAFIKARGEGLSLPLHEFDVAFAAGTRPRILRTAWSAHEPSEWTLCDISGFCPGAVAALAVRSAAAETVFKGHIG